MNLYSKLIRMAVVSLILIICVSLMHSKAYAKAYHIGLGPIFLNQNTIDLILLLKILGPYDTLHIIIDSPGGRLDVADKINEAMRGSKAKIVCHVPRFAASAAALLSTYSCLNYGKLDLSPMAIIVFHFPFYCLDLTCTLKEPVVGPERKDFYNMLKIHFRKILTLSEINRMYINNEDIVLNGSTILKRLGR